MNILITVIVIIACLFVGAFIGGWIGYGRGVSDTQADIEGRAQAAEFRAMKSTMPRNFSYYHVPPWELPDGLPAMRQPATVETILSDAERAAADIRALIAAYPEPGDDDGQARELNA